MERLPAGRQEVNISCLSELTPHPDTLCIWRIRLGEV